MPIEELQRIALRISCQTFTRWWTHYNHPCQRPWLMCIAFCGSGHEQRISEELEALGFKLDAIAHEAVKGNIFYYTIERTMTF